MPGVRWDPQSHNTRVHSQPKKSALYTTKKHTSSWYFKSNRVYVLNQWTCIHSGCVFVLILHVCSLLKKGQSVQYTVRWRRRSRGSLGNISTATAPSSSQLQKLETKPLAPKNLSTVRGWQLNSEHLDKDSTQVHIAITVYLQYILKVYNYSKVLWISLCKYTLRKIDFSFFF